MFNYIKVANSSKCTRANFGNNEDFPQEKFLSEQNRPKHREILCTFREDF